jgi:predicted permease
MSTRDDEDFDREIRAHLALEADRLADDGLSRAEAESAARRAFGNVLRAREDYHERSRWTLLEQLGRDVRYGWRGLRRSPTFAATTILTLSVGLALITVVFALFNAYVLRPFSVRDPYRLYEIGWRAQATTGRSFTWAEYSRLRERVDLFDGTIAEVTRTVSSEDRELNVAFVSGNYFATLGARIRVGRALDDTDTHAPGSEPVAVLSEQGWARLFNRDPAVLGRTVTFHRQTFAIVGVLSGTFSGLDDTPRDLWIPLTMFPAVTNLPLFVADGPRALDVVTRLRSGVTAEQARRALTAFMATVGSVRQTVPLPELHLKATPVTLSVDLVEVLLPVFAAFGLVLAAACANVSNIMLTRANARHREIGVRLALGASRGRVIRQLMAEGLVIALGAGLGALALAAVLLRVGSSLFARLLPPAAAASALAIPLPLDYRVFLFTGSLAALATLLFALVPALRATGPQLTAALRGEPGSSIKASTFRSLLVALQVAVSLVILIPAATLIRNGAAIQHVDPGIETRDVTAVRVRGTGRPLLLTRASEVLAADSRVERLAVASRRPLSEEMRKVAVTGAQSSRTGSVPYTFVSPEYFETLRLPLLRGRSFRDEESRTEAHVAIVSAAAADAFWPGVDPIGRTLRVVPPAGGAEDALAGYSDVVVIGVAQDVMSGLVFDGRDPSHLYLPTSAAGARTLTLLVRSRPTEDGSVALQEALRSIDPDPLAFETLTFDDVMAMQLFPLRAASLIGSLLGAVALALSVSGLSGMVSYSLSQRVREMGIRMALGATSSGVIVLVMRESARLVGCGATVGFVVAFAVMSVLRSIVVLQNVSFLDTVAFAGALALVIGTGAIAAFFPARRAARIEPALTLRAEG